MGATAVKIAAKAVRPVTDAVIPDADKKKEDKQATAMPFPARPPCGIAAARAEFRYSFPEYTNRR